MSGVAEGAPETARANAEAAAVLARSLVAGGVRHVVMSPGSRSTPLVLAFADADARTHVVLDERVAAFVALGLARVAGPVALVCTSGSAGAHWLPAVIEARHSRVPLILLTADRPPELHGCGAPQTVPQAELFAPYALLRVDVGPASAGVDPRWLRTVAARLLDAARGPVHANVAFREPLWEPGAKPVAVEPARILRPPPTADASTAAAVAERLVGRGVIYAGPRAAPPGDRAVGAAVARLGAALGWPVVAEPLSQLRGHSTGAVLGMEPPEVVLRLGQPPTRRRVAERLVGAETVLVDPDGDWLDPSHTTTLLAAVEPASLCEALVPRVRPADPAWLAAWEAADADARARAASLCDTLWEGAVAREVAAALPPSGLLHVASSMPVRDLDAFAPPAPFAVTSNRGANGIDGTIATALGASLGWRGPVVALVGDLAFLHDHAALHAARALGARLVVVVADNGGGGIFGTLPIARHEGAFERLFLTPQPGDLAAAAAGLGAYAVRVDDLQALRRSLSEALARDGVTVIHAVVDRETANARRARL
ncbi:MAG: 2-succinyl-5-enolpyruvyl-6-hydroxy-3-cyclohexene-1-carboxylate synthase [Myxococcales bacterium]